MTYFVNNALLNVKKLFIKNYLAAVMNLLASSGITDGDIGCYLDIA